MRGRGAARARRGAEGVALAAGESRRMSTSSPHRISPPAEHCFVYEECTIPPGITLDQWRRAPRDGQAPWRRRLFPRIGRLVR
jgi:hypothetical protein